MENHEILEALKVINSKLDKVQEETHLLPQILEIVTANGQGIETLSSRIDKLERVSC